MDTIDPGVGRSRSHKAAARTPRAADRNSGTRSDPVSSRPLALARPQDIVHGLLFVLEYSNSHDPRWREHRRHLSLFFSRHGGLHLLLMLLNAYYNKPAAGRRPGWVFNGLHSRIDISERGLRMLINDAVDEGLIELQPIDNENDRRCRSYRLKPEVIRAWEALTGSLLRSMGGVFQQFDAGALANVDYRKWDPARPARDQIDTLPPSHRLRRRQQALLAKADADAFSEHF